MYYCLWAQALDLQWLALIYDVINSKIISTILQQNSLKIHLIRNEDSGLTYWSWMRHQLDPYARFSNS